MLATTGTMRVVLRDIHPGQSPQETPERALVPKPPLVARTAGCSVPVCSAGVRRSSARAGAGGGASSSSTPTPAATSIAPLPARPAARQVVVVRRAAAAYGVVYLAYYSARDVQTLTNQRGAQRHEMVHRWGSDPEHCTIVSSCAPRPVEIAISRPRLTFVPRVLFTGTATLYGEQTPHARGEENLQENSRLISLHFSKSNKFRGCKGGVLGRCLVQRGIFW